tara:strand:+ start:1470 stop:2168 length:699 start_codon:yes stop_codon:yes gene_type:complete
MKSFKLIVSVALVLASAIGCVRSESLGKPAPFEQRSVDACLAVVVDLSGSFHGSLDERAYALFNDLSQQFFADTMGTESRFVLAQLSASDDIVLFEGTPRDLRQRFRSPGELSEFLKSNADPAGSQVYESVRRTIDYVSAINGVDEQTRIMTVIFSDMRESESDQQLRREQGYQMLDALRRYRETGGGLAMYFVGKEQTSVWDRILKEAGFERGHYIIENELTESPQLPRMD